VSEESQPLRRAGAPVALWLALAVPPLALLADLEVGYALAPRACRDGSGVELLVSSALALALTAASGVVAWRAGLRRAREEPHSSEALRRGQVFLARGGAVLAAAVALVLVAMAAVRAFQGCG
jgi:hypothetical protein